MKRSFIPQKCSLENETKRIRLNEENVEENVLVSGRPNYISWDSYFMLLCGLSSERSKDPCTQVGAVIVNNKNRIIGIGYNGFPNGINDSQLSWGKNSTNQLYNKKMFVVHAEKNAILNCNTISCEGCVLYCKLFPCNDCMQSIIQAGIKKVIFANYADMNKDEYQASVIMAQYAGVVLEEYQGLREFTIKI